MAYKYTEEATTRKGTVIYKRKKHEFGWKDIWRLIKKFGGPSDIDQEYYELKAMLLILRDVPMEDVEGLDEGKSAVKSAIYIRIEEIEKDPSWEGFGGGTFRGAGATGTWLPAFPLPPIFLPDGDEDEGD